MKKNLLHRSLSRGVTSGSSSSGSYIVNLNGQWEKTTTISNPDSSVYDGVYRSVSNYNVGNGVATMYITIKDYSSFKLYIRSYAESSYDYVMVSQLDQTITGSTSYSNTTLVKTHTRGNQQSGAAIGNYTLVEFTGIPSGEHTITIVYRKDSSVNSGDDRGYVLIDKDNVNGDESNEDSIDIIANYLTIEALEDGLTAKLSSNACEYCVDGDGVWIPLAAATTTKSINTGQTLSFRGNAIPGDAATIGIGTFTISKKCNLLGNCMSILNNKKSLTGELAFCSLFAYNDTIITVSKDFLPATTLTEGCYDSMFYECTNLISAPDLPATTLTEDCYYSMFWGCTSLTTPPNIFANKLATTCCESMFSGCKSLTEAPALPATTLAYGCYRKMFGGCNNLIKAPELPATTLVNYCYYNMFYRCKSLTETPVLHAVTLTEHCYDRMFYGCSSLNKITMLATDISASACLANWVIDVPSTGTFIKSSEMTSLPKGQSGIPERWTVINV